MNVELMNKQKEYLAEQLSGKRIMVSGGTGLIGSAIVRYLLDLNECFQSRIEIIALYRNEEKKERMFPGFRNHLSFVKYDTTGIHGDIRIDYLIHAAGISGGTKMHLKDPVAIFTTGIYGTKDLLDYAVNHGCQGFCYVSTYEIYGNVSSAELIPETYPCSLDPTVLRNSYAEVKRVCESMLSAYAAAYGIKVYSGRLTSTFGTGVTYQDPRFFAEFGRNVIECRNIVLKSSGGTVRSYLDSDDAAAAFLYILVNGETNNAYNLTNMDNAISIRDMAQKFIDLSGKAISLEFDIADDIKKLGFRQESQTLIDARKVEALGWKPVYSLEDTILKLLETMKDSCA